MFSDRLRANVLLKEYALEVDLRDIVLFSEELASSVQERPGDVMPLVCGHNDFTSTGLITLTNISLTSPTVRACRNSLRTSNIKPTSPDSWCTATAKFAHRRHRR